DFYFGDASTGEGGAPELEPGGAPSSAGHGAELQGGAAGAGGEPDAATGTGGDSATGDAGAGGAAGGDFGVGGAGGADAPAAAGAGGASDAAAGAGGDAPEGAAGAGGACTDSTCAPGRCGDGTRDDDEECDDGNDSNSDACTTNCKSAVCGERYVHLGVEDCDDGNDVDDDSCPANCRIECGDGFRSAGEDCDDGNTVNNDGCSRNCVVEPYCESFTDVTCSTGATHWCQLTPTSCGAEDSEEAKIACQVCTGQPCEIVGGPGGCDNASMAPSGSCALTFLYGGGLCNLNAVADCNGVIGSWCDFD